MAPGVVLVVGARGAGYCYRPAPAPATAAAAAAAEPSPLSLRAQRELGLRTREDAEREWEAAKRGWSQGRDYHCPFCARDFWSPSGARKHMLANAHPVLRMDWDAGRPERRPRCEP